jgi:fructose/tagatose bisphosphate aldolase
MTEAIRSYLQNNPDVVDPRKYLSAGRTAVEAGVYDYLKALSN